MKPRNKFQERVFALSKKLPSISETQKRWAYRHCIDHKGRRTKKGIISCLECGHQWTDKISSGHCTCPHCHTKLVMEDTPKRVFDDYQYFCIISVCEGFQVLRFFYIGYKAKAGEKARYFCSEVVQRWVVPGGKYVTVAKLRPIGFYVDTWCFASSLEIRPDKRLYNVIPTCIYPRQRLIPELKRGGYKGNCYDLTPFDLFHTLLSDSRAETLLKARQIETLRFFVKNGFHHIKDYWASVKICIRNGYTIPDASIWRDYIDLLRFFGKDTHNAKYVCPSDLKAEHDKYVQKKREYRERERREADRKRALEDEAEFTEMKSKFFGICFTDGLIQVRVLESVKEVMLEGDALHHCVFTNDYHLKPDSLILSACIGEKRIETIELSLSRLQVLQSRGVCNENSRYHNRILKLVEKNIPLIQKRIAV